MPLDEQHVDPVAGERDGGREAGGAAPDDEDVGGGREICGHRKLLRPGAVAAAAPSPSSSMDSARMSILRTFPLTVIG